MVVVQNLPSLTRADCCCRHHYDYDNELNFVCARAATYQSFVNLKAQGNATEPCEAVGTACCGTVCCGTACFGTR